MKHYLKPTIKLDIQSEINEPIFMQCSGQEFFYLPSNAIDYEHQSPVQGRADTRFQANAYFNAAPGTTYNNRTVYCYLAFPEPNIVVDRVSDWHTVNTWSDGNKTYWIGAQTYTLNAGDNPPDTGNHIGFGDLFAYNSVSPLSEVAEPLIGFSFGYTYGTVCI